MRQVYHIARAYFLQRIRSRRLLVVLAIVVYLGYLVNVGTVELFYQDTSGEQTIQYIGEPTAAYIGLTAGATGAMILFVLGYYLLTGSIKRDRTSGVDRTVASMPVTDRAYLFGKWLSHVGLVIVLLGTLGIAAILNHLIHGTGTTDAVWILGPIFLMGLPVGGIVAGVTILFQSTRRLSGTLGNIAYFFAALTLLTAVVASGSDYRPGAYPRWLQASEIVGLFATAQMTYDALVAVAPDYEGLGIANFGTGAEGAEIVAFHWDGASWPLWFLGNRLILLLFGVTITLIATIPYERFKSSDEPNSRGLAAWARDIVPSFARFPAADLMLDVQQFTNSAVSQMGNQQSGGFGRLVRQELLLLLRGQPWWWYTGAVLIGIVGLTGGASTAPLVWIAAIWPLFLWSSMGVRPNAHQMTPFIVSSNRPFSQLFAEWAAGVIITIAFLGVALFNTIITTGANGVIVLLGAIVFIPSLAQAMGLWSNTRRLFELTYLLLWYAGPLNGVTSLDYAGATSETAGTVIPMVFFGLGAVAVLTSISHRSLQT